MGDFPRMLSGWSWEENKLFELALAAVDEQDPDRWESVACMSGREKSAEDVRKRYVILLQDLECIESGEFDHSIVVGEADCSQTSPSWTDDDNKLLVQLNIN